MSNYPSDIDDDATLPVVNDNLTEIGGEAINALRDAVVQIETALGTNIAGSAPSLAARLGVFINPDGSPNASVLTSLGLVTLPIRNDQISENAGIPESKLHLDFRTQDLFNYIRDLSLDVNTALGWISVSGIKLDPHLIGALYRHTMDQIDVSNSTTEFLQNNLRTLRDNLNSYTLVADINNELLAHQWADGSPFGDQEDIVTNNGSLYKNIYGHTASGIFINPSRFTHIPQVNDDLQLFANFVDTSIINQQITLQNINSNGISKISRSSSLNIDGYGQPLVPATSAITYLKNIGNNSSPFDDISTGDDIIEFEPSTISKTTNSFDEMFALVRPGDIIRVNYGDGYNIEVPFIIKEKKYIQSGGNKKYIVRIDGKNLFYSPHAIARIDKSLPNDNKYGVLAIAPVNNPFSATPSLIVGNPRSAQALGVGFNQDKFDESHYLLYLVLYPTGQPQDGYTILPAIDVTGNKGVTPGYYTLESIVASTNASLRQSGFNYRFIAYSYKGDFGIMLADPYNNAAFSIINGVVSPGGVFDQSATNFVFPKNVIDIFPTAGNTVAPDPLGLGALGAGLASPPYMTVYGSAEASQIPTIVLVPLKRNNYYVDGTERERLNLEVGQALDTYGDGYWVGTIQNITVFPGTGGHVQTTYSIPLDLSTSNLKVGKTLVVQSLGDGSLVDFGRFVINNVSFECFPTTFTEITVYDAVHATGISPSPTLGIGSKVAIYFSSDSISFNSESATDFAPITPFKRHFEVYVDAIGETFTHERGRIAAAGANITVNGVILRSSSELAKMDLFKISSKLRGYQFGPVNKITLNITNYDATIDTFSGFLASYDGVTFTHQGLPVTGRKGEVVRFYDESNIDYIDITFDIGTTVNTFSSAQQIDIQLFPSLSLDQEIMMIGTCQLDDQIEFISRIRDERQFGNTSEKELSTSALDFMAVPEKLLHINGVVRGFDIININAGVITINGGVALVEGKFQYINNQTLIVPKVQEKVGNTNFSINWALCCNSIGDLVLIPLTDYDVAIATVPNSPTRSVILFNAVTGNTYQVDSSTFTNILNNRKDLTLMFILTATVTGTGTSATVAVVKRDVRRFINDQDSNIAAVVMDPSNVLNTPHQNYTSQGNFRSFDSAATWIRLNNKFQNVIQIKGNTTATSDPLFNQSSMNNTMDVEIVGASRSSLTFNTSVTMSNVSFRNLDVAFNGAVNLTNVNFTNCTVLVNSGGLTSVGGVLSNNIVQITGPTVFNGTTIEKCSYFNIVGSLTLTSVNFNGPILQNTGGILTVTSSTLNGCAITTAGNTTFTSSNFTGPSLNITGSLTVTDGYINSATITDTSTATFTRAYFNGCTITSGGAGSFSFVNMNYTTATINSGGLLVGNNINIDVGGLIVAAGTVTASNSFFSRARVNFVAAATLTNDKFVNCDLTFGAGGTFTNVFIDPSNVTIGGIITTVSPFTMTDCIVQVNVPQAFTISSFFRFERNTITYAGVAGGGYTPTELVNASSGMIFGSVNTAATGGLTDVIIRDNTFNTALTNRFPFVTIQLPNATSILENVDISKNKFFSTATVDDLRAVIAIVSTVTTAPGSYPLCPKLVDVFIEHNICNHNQIIAVTMLRIAAQPITGSMLVCVNTRISNNVCGTIGFITGTAQIANFSNATPSNNGFIGDKEDQLIISGNSCQLITNIDSKGAYIAFRSTAFPTESTDWVQVSTGPCSITNNVAHWIQVGCSSYAGPTSGGAVISGNQLSPGNPDFLTNYTAPVHGALAPDNSAIILRRESNTNGLTHSIISNNIISQKALQNADGTTTTYYYNSGIAAFNNAQIIGNTITGVLNSSIAPILYLWGQDLGIGPILMVTNNILNRAGLTIQSYVTGQSNATNRVMIKDNIFDSPYIDTGNTNDGTGYNIPAFWDFYANKNQTGYKYIDLTKWQSTSLHDSLGVPWNSPEASITSGIYYDHLYVPSLFHRVILIASGAGGAPDPQRFTMVYNVNLNNALPENVKIVFLNLGLFNDVSSNIYTKATHALWNAGNYHYFTFQLSKSVSNSFNPTSPATLAQSVGDVYYHVYSTPIQGIDSSPANPTTLVPTSKYLVEPQSVTDFQTSTNYLSLNCNNSTTIGVASNGVALPTGTINVVSTASFPTSGTLYISMYSDSGSPLYTPSQYQTINYTGKTATTFTGCTGGSSGGGVYLMGTGMTVQLATEQDIFAPNSANNWTTTKNQELMVLVTLTTTVTKAGGAAIGTGTVTGTSFIQLSPLQVKYRW